MTGARVSWLVAAAFSLAGCQTPAPTGLLELRLPTSERDPNHPSRIYREDLPGRSLVTRWSDLERLGLLDRALRVPDDRLPWSSGFFPNWLGGVAGRWQDGAPRLLLRSVMGFKPLAPDEAVSLLKRGQEGAADARRGLFSLSPLEKYDLAVGDYDMSATQTEARLRGHNVPRAFLDLSAWSGYCNGMSRAAVLYKEPVRAVEVVNPDGYAIAFHPNDIKALLGLHELVRPLWVVGRRCDALSTDSEECQGMNPGTFLIALANRLGRAGRSILIDIDPLEPVLNAAIRSGRISVLQPPHVPPAPQPAGVAKLATVRFELETSTTQLSDRAADRPVEGQSGLYQHVNDVRHLTYEAELAIDSSDQIIGGRWAGPRLSGPNFAWGPESAPGFTGANEDRIGANRYVNSSLILALAHASAGGETGAPRPRIELPPEVAAPGPRLYAQVYTRRPGPNTAAPVVRAVRLLGRAPSAVDHLSCWLSDATGASKTWIGDLPLVRRPGRFVYFDGDAVVSDRGAKDAICDFFERRSGTGVRVARIEVELNSADLTGAEHTGY